MSSTPFIDCSSGVATACSIVTASAPVKLPVTMICGGTMFGNCATGSPRSETAPTITVTIAITIATIGRRMKNADMSAARRSAGLGARHEWFGAYFGAGIQLTGVDHHAVAGIDPLLH